MSATSGSELYVGLMSGTSLDGIDIAIVDFAPFPPNIRFSNTIPFDHQLLAKLQALCAEQTISLDSLYRIDAELGILYGETVNASLQQANLNAADIIAIGSHGQTICHSPNSSPAYTGQIGDANRIAALTGIDTVADFRGKDLAMGGQAAPLAPAFHKFIFHHSNQNRVILNIGGIANITCLPADSHAAVLGFDTGPGNCLLDYWNRKNNHTNYDDAGKWAASGEIIEALLARMLDEKYFQTAAPKSTGTDYFNVRWLSEYANAKLAPVDIQTTLVELSAKTIANAIAALPTKADSCFVCGGGARNHYLLERLQAAMPDCTVATTTEVGLDADFVEAVAFAWLARERINMRPGNLTEVTRASRATVLGAVYPAA